MRFFLTAAFLTVGTATFAADDFTACDGWELDRMSLEALISANKEWHDTLADIPTDDPSAKLARRMIAAMDMVLEGANGANEVTGGLYERLCPKPS